MDTLSLRLFIRVAEVGNVTKASKDLALSPASASARLAKLEALLGFRLFNRTTRALSLTTDGAMFLPYAKQSIELLEDGLSVLKGKHNAPKGVLRFAMPASFARMYIVPMLAEFRALYPDIQLDLHLSDNVNNPVEGAYDLIIRNSQLTDSNLIARKLAKDKRLLVASPRYLAKHGTPKTPQDLVKHHCVLFDNHTKWQFESGELIKVPNTLSINDGVAMRHLLENGAGIGIKSIWNVNDSIQSGKLVEVLANYPLQADVGLWLLYPSNRMLSPKVRVMIDYLIKKFQPAPWEKNML